MKTPCVQRCRSLKKYLLVLMATAVNGLASAAAPEDPAENVQFNPAFLRSKVDISQFAQGNPVSPGTHRVDLYLNERAIGRHSLRFEQPSVNALIARPCFDLQTLNLLGIDVEKLSEAARIALTANASCIAFETLVEGGSAQYDSSNQRLDISAPQIVLQRQARGYVPPSLWDEGITAASLQYDYNAYRSEQNGFAAQSSQYLSLRGGFNHDAWRLRYRGSFYWSSPDNTLHYQSTATYLERSIIPLKSHLTLGEASTDGQVFDSVSFRGVRLSSDERMSPDAQRGFSPIVRGIAQTNALVKISQNGLEIYETTVPPGPFAIDDFYPVGRGGNLLVTVKEADGRENQFTVSFSAITELLRPGTTRYSLMAGSYASKILHNNPQIAMGTLRHGISNLLTGYTGVLAAEGYSALSLGMAFNTQFGGFSLDNTRSLTTLPGLASRQGNSLRFSYAKIIPITNTNLMLTAYRNSNADYYNAQEALGLRDYLKQGVLADTRQIGRQRDRLNISASQNLPNGYGAFSINASYQNYWQQRRADTQYQFSYSNNFRQASFSITAQRARDPINAQWDNQLMLSVSIPLGSGNNAPSWNSNFSSRPDGNTLNNSVSGSAGEDQQFNYRVFSNTAQNKDSGSDTSVGASGTWSAPAARLSGNISSGKNFKQYGLSVSGGMVAYADGLVLASAVGETMAIIEAKAAQGARVSGYSDLRLDRNGKSIVPYLTPFRQNSVEIDPFGLSTDVELKVTSQSLVPTAGAIMQLNFATETGYSILMSARKASGEPLPFGAAVLDSKGENISHIAQGGLSLVRVQTPKGVLQVKWGSAPTQNCSFAYQLPDLQTPAKGDYRRLAAICR